LTDAVRAAYTRRVMRVRMGGLLLACLALAGCGLFAPESTRNRARVLTAQPDAKVPCACRTTPKRLRFTSISPVGVALCGGGTALTEPTPALACGTLYVGGGSPKSRAVIVQGVDAVFDAWACSGDTVFLTGSKKGATGGSGACTGVGCPLGAPAPAPDPNSAASTCTVLEVAGDPVGLMSCRTGDGGVSIPLKAHVYVTGDVLPRVAGVQPCPVCTGPAGRQTCKGGARNGKRCHQTVIPTDGTQPTSQDCPPDRRQYAGTFEVPLVLDTQTQTATAVAVSTETRGQQVFCGFCRDADGKGNFQGSRPAHARPCQSNGDCAQPYEACDQRSGGAFRRTDATSASAKGAAGGTIQDGEPHPAMLASVVCVPPSFDDGLDAAFDLPGPAAVSLPGMLQLQ
jgi:hypothetical protein